MTTIPPGATSKTAAPRLRLPDLDADVLSVCAALIRIDTSNPGKLERPAAEYVAGLLAEVGIEGQLLEAEPGRSNYIVRIEGDGSSSEALVVHGHLDVVPADPEGWRHPPFSGHLDDGCLWGRGAVDMKDMIAMTRRPPPGLHRDETETGFDSGLLRRRGVRSASGIGVRCAPAPRAL